MLKGKGYKFKAYMILRSTASSKTRWLNRLLKIFNISKEVEFISYQNSMKDFYKKLDCLVMPSVEEAFGLVALESMLNKVPCIVSSCSGVSEIIEDGYNGFIFNSSRNSAKNLVNKMTEVMNNPEKIKNVILNGYETAKEYNWNKTFKALEQELLVLPNKNI